MKKRNLIAFLILAAIFLTGLFLRLYRLNLNTPPLYADQTGGNYWYLHQIHDPSVSFINRVIKVIITTPISFSWSMGFSALSAKLPPAVSGSLLILVMYFFSLQVVKRLRVSKVELISLIASVLVAVLPWSFMTSRLYGNIPMILILVCLHLTLFIKGKSIKDLVISLLPLLLSAYYYPSMVFLVPLGSLIVISEIWKKSNNLQKKYLIGLCLATVSVVSYMVFTRFQLLNTNSRGLDLAIWRDANVTADANKYRGLARLSEPTIFSFNQDTENIGNKLVYNYPISIISTFTRNYLSFFSLDFLFLKGDNVLRHSTGMVGNIFPFLLPFMIYGALIFFQRTDKKTKSVFLVWILISPIPAAITKDGATYLLRAITMMPFLTYFCAQGIVSSFNLFKNRLSRYFLGTILLLLGLYSTYYFYYGYFHVYPALSAESYEFGFKELSDFQKQNNQSLFIIWDDKYPVNHFCFWQNLPHIICDPKKMTQIEFVNTSRVDLPIPNLFFSLPKTEGDLDLILTKYKPIYLAIPSRYSKYFPDFVKKLQPVHTINNPDLSIAFSIYKVN